MAFKPIDSRQIKNRSALSNIGAGTNDTLDDILSKIDASINQSLRTENPQTGSTYTFALPDGSGAGHNPYVTLTNASAVTATVPSNASVAFPIGTEIQIIQGGAGPVMVDPGAGVTINSLNGQMVLLGQNAEATLIKQGINNWYLYGDLAGGFMIATGGTITTDGNFKVHTFTSSGTFQVLSGSGVVDSLVIGGGGGGNGSVANYGGGGGAGGMRYTSPGAIYGVGSYAVTVGSGGLGGNNGSPDASNGSNSVFDIITSLGGGAGGGGSSHNGASGGSGGGGDQVGSGGTGTVGQGNNGGTGQNIISLAGGGGGSGSVGANASNPNAGNGGSGTSNSITGSAIMYASGGGGGASGGAGGIAGMASAGGGGNGSSTGPASSATANTGGGGGGATGSSIGGAGGSGVVILRYQFQ